LEAGPVHVELVGVRGRGHVWIFQQPRADNDYTVGVRIRDPQPGRGFYRFALNW
jgi:hypothetical protein